MISVMIVDDHALVRAGLAELLEGDAEIRVVGTAAGGEEALEVALRERPDVVLMDLSMPGMGGAEATRRLVDSGSDARVVVLTSLSAREREVLALVGEGLPNKLIARRLEISEKTVKAHLTQVFAQLGVTDRTQAALWLERNGLPEAV